MSASRIVLASPQRYADLGRLWHRFVSRELQPAFAGSGAQVDVDIFCDGDAAGFRPDSFPGVTFSRPAPGMRDFIEFYDASLKQSCEFLFFADADVFFFDGRWVASHLDAFQEPSVAAVSFVPRKSEPAIFALLCRTEAYRLLPEPVLACRYEFPAMWPNGVNLQPGDFAARELAKLGNRIVNICEDESSRHIMMFRSTTGVRAMREQITRASGVQAFYQFLAQNPACIAAAYDNVLLGALYERVFGEAFAVDASGTPFGDSVTMAELRIALSKLCDRQERAKLEQKFQSSQQSIARLAAHENIELDFSALTAELGLQR
jgi:hypothetical protein